MNDHDYMLLKRSLSSALVRLRAAHPVVDLRTIRAVEGALKELSALDPNREAISTAMLLSVAALQLLSPDDNTLAATMRDQARMIFGISQDGSP